MKRFAILFCPVLNACASSRIETRLERIVDDAVAIPFAENHF